MLISQLPLCLQNMARNHQKDGDMDHETDKLDYAFDWSETEEEYMWDWLHSHDIEDYLIEHREDLPEEYQQYWPELNYDIC